MRRTAQVAVLLLVAVTASHGLVRAYSVEPVSALLSGKVWGDPQYGGVSEVLTCCWDQLDGASGAYVELFAGDYGQGGACNLAVTDYVSGQPVASQTGVLPGGDHTWLRFGGITMEPGRAFTKGKQYEFKFTRSGSDSGA